LNCRSRSSPRVRARVEQAQSGTELVGTDGTAAEQLRYAPNGFSSATIKTGILGVIIPAGTYYFFRKLEAAFERIKGIRRQKWADRADSNSPSQDWQAIVNLLQTEGQLFDAVAVIAGDHPVIVEAVNAYRRQGKGVICIVADLPSSARQSFIGIDNRPAGKTAARLVSEFGRSGSVGILTSSLQQRDHQERLLGFRSSLETLAPNMRIVGVEEALDRQEICYRFTKGLPEQDTSLKAVYHFGADVTGIVHAIQEADRTDEIVVIGHELTDNSRHFLARERSRQS
jgi:LacI family transcriptional regulator